MPSALGFPPSPTVGQQFPTVSPTREWNGSVWRVIAVSAVPSTPVTLRLSSLTNTDDFIALRVISGELTPHLVGADVVAEFAGGTPSATAPASFTVGMWTLTAIAGGLQVAINSLPADGGSAITALEYTLNAGTSWIAFSGTGTGNRNVTGLPETLQTMQIRAVNAVDAGAASDSKSATPLAAGGGGSLAFVQSPTPVEQPYGTVAEQTMSAVGTGNTVVVVVASPSSAAEPTITDSAGGSWGTAFRTYVDGEGSTTRYWVRNGVTGNPTWVRATHATSEGFHIAGFELSGAGAGAVEDDWDSGVQSSTSAWDMPFTSTAANTAVFAMLKVSNGNTPTGTSPLVVATATGGYQIFAHGIFPSSGANTATVTLNTGLAGTRSWLVLKAS